MNKREFKKKYWYPISVSIEIALRKVRIKIDSFYRKNWIYVFILLMLPYFSFAVYQMMHDYDLMHNCANLDAPFDPIYTKWRTDGTPGVPPPGGDR